MLAVALPLSLVSVLTPPSFLLLLPFPFPQPPRVNGAPWIVATNFQNLGLRGPALQLGVSSCETRCSPVFCLVTYEKNILTKTLEEWPLSGAAGRLAREKNSNHASKNCANGAVAFSTTLPPDPPSARTGPHLRIFTSAASSKYSRRCRRLFAHMHNTRLPHSDTHTSRQAGRQARARARGPPALAHA